MSEIVINSVLPDQFHEIRNVAPHAGAATDEAAKVLADALNRADAARQTNQKRDSGFLLPKGDR